LSEFKKAVKDFRFELNESEIELAFKAFDRNGDGNIDYDEFLRQVRGNMNNNRKRLVDQAWNKMDRDGNGVLDINDIKGVYNARSHPDVKQGKKTEEEVLFEFLETFETHHNIIDSDAPDHLITREEWQEYYENVSMSIDDDPYFELMMNNCWRMNSNTTSNNEKKGWSNKEEGSKSNELKESYSKKFNADSPKKSGTKFQQESSNKASSENPLLEKFRQKLMSRGGRGIIGLSRQFKIFDDNNNKTLELEEFVKACRDFKIDLSPSEIKTVFQMFDRDSQGTIDYDEFLRAVKGQMNDRRKKIVLQVYEKLDQDKSGVIDINDIKYTYNVKSHPDVKSGKKTEEDVYGEFLETFETHHNINRGSKDRRVTREEFLEYYNNISMSIDNDEYFELMMTNAWKLGQQPKGGNVDNKVAGKKLDDNRIQSAKPHLNAPWGTTGDPVNYSTANRPGTGGQGSFSKKGDPVMLAFRDKLAARGTRGIMGIRRSFKICDDDNSGTISFPEFKKLIKDYRIDLNDEQIKKLFNIFDRDQSGILEYDEFVNGIVGEMNDFRKGFVKKAFAKMDKNSNGALELDDIKGVYNAKNHPDVKKGKKTEDEVLAEFLDNFEYHFSMLVSINFNFLE
jgi:Ca2+-binding EF-hand superfamily protein